MKFFTLPLICLMFLSCNNHNSKKTNVTSSVKKTPNKPFEKLFFTLDSLEGGRKLYDSIKALPQIDLSIVKPILSKLPDDLVADNMLLNKRYTSFRKIADLDINGKPGLVFARITNYNSLSGNIYLLIKDPSDNKIIITDLAEYFSEGGGESHVKSAQISPNEFVQISDNSDIQESDKPDSLGVRVPVGRWQEKVTRKLLFNNNRFTTSTIDSTYKIEK